MVDVGGRHVVEGLVAEDAGVVDEDVDPTEPVECGFDDLRRGLRLGHVVMIGHRGASRGGGLGDELLGGRFSRWAAVNPGTDVVDDDECHRRSEDSGVLPGRGRDQRR